MQYTSLLWHKLPTKEQSIAHMHSIGFVHRDIKSLNVFLTDAGEASGVRLGDFGESVTNAAAEAEDPKQVGTPQW